MNTLRTAAQQALEALENEHNSPRGYGYELSVYEARETAAAITALKAALAEPEGQREKEIEELRFSLDFYQRRCEALQSWQSKMRDPERTIVCDILANGFTLDPAFAGDRYIAPPQRKPLSLTDLQEALVYTNLIDRDAIDDPDNYDEGSTVAQIDELHRVITGDNT